ncbi:MAG: DUF418 domain-containing protein [Alphaproteobacteria bacterium]|nr:DUF418 domain-containing protein [Alphaproteobacteria bacterium]MBU1526227.1 DUF418 domain-containing protein [Alphaproteobacteria bacterium]MBU2116438.1 DUF418 domain-containing protein [Alphaproteobacteria bacterium]MBU2351384.1 DUF418 domain-containing protein [Alphaproteobacteria bacterium]MBU2382094.1 DUF418 domain-containing protein [Alphaproteobacteria bacterium]
MHDDDRAVPSAAAERITAVDALRGFALLGVFVANLFTSFSGWFLMDAPQRVALAGPVQDIVSAVAFVGLIDGKFYSLFSLLFGASFAIMLARLDGRGAPGVAIFRRRLSVLLAFGLIHLVFIWFGDILTLYALLGFLLVFLRGWSDRRLLVTAVVLILLVVPLKAALRASGVPLDLGVYSAVTAFANATGTRSMVDPAAFPEFIGIIRDPSWPSFFLYQFQGAIWRFGSLLESGRPFKVLALMMLGLIAGRRLVAGTLLTDRKLLKPVLIFGLVFGIPGNALYVFGMATMDGSDLNGVLQDAGYALGVIPLALAYGAGFLLAWPKAKPVLGVFSAPGRMALTNYVMQSVLGTAVFFGIGLGWIGHMAPLQFVGLGLALFAGQIVLSAVWLRLFGQGPLEALWRRLTYGARA